MVEENIEHILSRNVDSIVDEKHLKKRLLKGETLRIKHGIDPTSSSLHLGHAIVLWKLKQFQDAGHTIVLILGDYTAQIGDPSDKLHKRPFLSEAQVNKNLKTYKRQIKSILDIRNVEWHRNSKWFKKLSLRKLDELSEFFSVSQMLSRRSFKDRLKNEEEISLRELHYPLYQGYDSVMVRADVEVGGTDQLFNLLSGRKIQQAYKQKPQDIITMKMLVGTDGNKMSKTQNNIIALDDAPQEKYGKIMSISDDLIEQYFTLCTLLNIDEIEDILEKIKQGANPRDVKAQLAYEVVYLYHGKKKAQESENEFNRVFKHKKSPYNIPTYTVEKKMYSLVDVLADTGLSPSKGEARRLIKQGAVEIDHKIIKNEQYEFEPKSGMIIKVGKRRFIRLRRKPLA